MSSNPQNPRDPRTPRDPNATRDPRTTRAPRDPRDPRSTRDNSAPRATRGVPVRPQTRSRKRGVPRAVIAIYVTMALLILAICIIVAIVMVKSYGGSGSSSGSVTLNSSSTTSTSSAPSTASTAASVSTDSSSSANSASQSTEQFSDYRTTFVSTDIVWSSGAVEVQSTTSSGTTVYVTAYSKDFFKDDLFIGDSIFTGLSGYGYLPAESVAAKIGYTPSAAANTSFDAKGVSAAEYAISRQPKRIFIMLGSNTMDSRNNFSLMIEQYKALVSELQENCPDSEICVISIPPVTEDSSSAKAGNITNENIRAVNKDLESMTNALNVDWLDLNSMLSDENGYFKEEFAEQDGLHFKGPTYKVLLGTLQQKYDDSAEN